MSLAFRAGEGVCSIAARCPGSGSWFSVTDNPETSNSSVAPGEGTAAAVGVQLRSRYEPSVAFLTKHILEKAEAA